MHLWWNSNKFFIMRLRCYNVYISVMKTDRELLTMTNYTTFIRKKMCCVSTEYAWQGMHTIQIPIQFGTGFTLSLFSHISFCISRSHHNLTSDLSDTSSELFCGEMSKSMTCKLIYSDEAYWLSKQQFNAWPWNLVRTWCLMIPPSGWLVISLMILFSNAIVGSIF